MLDYYDITVRYSDGFLVLGMYTDEARAFQSRVSLTNYCKKLCDDGFWADDTSFVPGHQIQSITVEKVEYDG